MIHNTILKNFKKKLYPLLSMMEWHYYSPPPV